MLKRVKHLLCHSGDDLQKDSISSLRHIMAAEDLIENLNYLTLVSLL